jgi:hypothetical protein
MFLFSFAALWSLLRGERGDGRYCASPKATALCSLDSQSAHEGFPPSSPPFSAGWCTSNRPGDIVWP